VKPKLEDRSFCTEITPWGKTIGKGPDGNFLASRAQVFVNPYKTKRIWDKELDHLCMVQVQTEISKEEYEKLQKEEPHNEVQKIEDFIKLFLTNGAYGIHEETIADEDKEIKVEELGVVLLLALFNNFPEPDPTFIGDLCACVAIRQWKNGQGICGDEPRKVGCEKLWLFSRTWFWGRYPE